MRRKYFCVWLLTLFCLTGNAQRISLAEALALSIERNPAVKASELNTQRESALKGTAIDIPKTSVSLMYGQYNSYRNDNNITVTQAIPFPTVFSAQHKVNVLRVDAAQIQEKMTRSELVHAVRRTYNELLYLSEVGILLQQQDSLFRELLRSAQVQHRTGEGTMLQVTSAEAQQMEVSHKLVRNKADYTTALRQLQMLCQADSISGILGNLKNAFNDGDLKDSDLNENPSLLAMKQHVKLLEQEKKVEGSKLYPDLLLGYFNQTLIGPQQVNGVEQFFDESKRFQGVQVGVSVPLFFNASKARIKATDIAAVQARKDYEARSLAVNREYLLEAQRLEKNRMSIAYYEETGLKHADMLRDQSEKSYREGELDYTTLLINLRQALTIREGYLTALYDYNDSAIVLLLLTGK